MQHVAVRRGLSFVVPLSSLSLVRVYVCVRARARGDRARSCRGAISSCASRVARRSISRC
jgi:hypothetical protein